MKSRESGRSNPAGARVPVVRPSTAAATSGKTAAGMTYVRDSRGGGSMLMLQASHGPGANAHHDSPLLAAKNLAPRPATAGSVRRSEAGASGVRPMTALGMGPAGRRRPRITDLA